MIKPISTAEKSGKFSLDYLHKTLKSFKAPYLSAPVNSGAEQINYTLLVCDKADIKLHMQKLEKYIKSHPDDAEIKAELAKLSKIYF